MKPDRPMPPDEKLEAELAAWLRARDAGSAPERLRMQVAGVAEDESSRGRRWAWVRPMPALGGAIAVAALILVAVALRSPAAPTASGPAASGPAVTVMTSFVSHSPAPAASPSEDPYALKLPLGPWPRIGAVPAVPLDDVTITALGSTALFVAAAIFLLLLARSLFRSRLWADLGAAAPDLWRTLSRREWGARVAASLLVAVLAATGAGLLNLSESTPLTFGYGYGGGTDALLGWASNPTGRPSETGYYRFIPGGEKTITITLLNQGDLPLTVTSFDLDRLRSIEPGFSQFLSSVEMRLPPGATSDGGMYEPSAYSEPFHPFELPGGANTSLLLILHIKQCPASVLPGPTPQPSAPDQTDYVPPAGTVELNTLPFHYSVLGIEREADIQMFAAVDLVFGNYPVTCDG